MEDLKYAGNNNSPLESSEMRFSYNGEAENDYPKIFAGDPDVKASETTSNLLEFENNYSKIIARESDVNTLEPEVEENVITDFLEALKPQNEEISVNSSETFSFHISTHSQEEEGPTSSSEFGAENANSPFASTPRAEESKNDDILLQIEDVSEPLKQVEKVEIKKVLIDTRAPFESVKAAVSKFGGIVDWKAHRAQTLERRKFIEEELAQVQEEIPTYKEQYREAEAAKTQTQKELESTKRLIEELKLNLERAQTEEQQAKQDSKLAKLQVEELEQGIEGEASIAVKAQLEVARSRHIAADSELKSVKNELEQLHRDYVILVSDRDKAVKKAEVAVSASKEVEKAVEELTVELIDVKESLGFAHGAHLEAEEEKISAKMDRESLVLKFENELKAAEESREKLMKKILSKKDLKSRLKKDAASLVELKSELAAYVESKWKIDSEKEGLGKELKEVKLNIDKALVEINYLKMAEASLKLEIERERSEISATKTREENASVLVASLHGELSIIKSEISSLRFKVGETREKMRKLPVKLELAGQDSDEAKLLLKQAQEFWQKAKYEWDQAKAESKAMENKVISAQKETEAAKASEKLALKAIGALKDSEEEESSSRSDDVDGDSKEGLVTLSLEEYYELTKRAHEVEERAKTTLASVVSQVEVAKESESKTLGKLEEVELEMTAQKEALVVAIHKAEKAKESKLHVEQELRTWRAENEQRRKTGELVQESRSPRLSFENSNLSSNFIQLSHTILPKKGYVQGSSNEEMEPTAEVKGAKKKKKFFPRIFMFLARRKAHGSKSK